MALNVRLDLKQSQNLVMTPQLQQAIKLLQMSNLELGSFIEEELERNPLLQRDDSPQNTEEAAAPDQQDSNGAADSYGDMSLTNDQANTHDAIDAEIDNQWSSDTPGDQVLAGSGGLDGLSTAQRGSGSQGEESNYLEQTLSAAPSLRDHIADHIIMAFANPAERLIATQMIDYLDESGYFTAELEEIAESFNCPVETIESILATLQQCDPIGLFARDLRECLRLQLQEKNRFDPAMASLIDNLDLLAKRDFKALLSCCAVDQEDLSDMIAEIQQLDPRPALAFDHGDIQAITPDILMKQGLKGKWLVELNNDTLPRVLVDNAYYADVSQKGMDKQTKHYISECFQNANWLVKSLHQRATTILRVASEIVRQQDAFFEKGIEYLKPIVLRDIADVVEMHESTISRVTSNKYIATPRGIFELKYFFTSGVNSAEGGDLVSAESVKYKIKRLIDAEDPKKILSDDKLVTLLKTDGVDIARRTVAKYREALGIASSVQRRREKKAALQ